MTTVQCPTCGCAVQWVSTNPDRPFCSARCKAIDLGAWANEAYVIVGSPAEDDATAPEAATH